MKAETSHKALFGFHLFCWPLLSLPLIPHFLPTLALTSIIITTGNPGSVIVPRYGSSKITVFVWGKNIILKFPGNISLSIFPAGEGGFGQMMYWSPERSSQDSRDGFFLYTAQASFSWPRVDLARLLPGMFIFRWSSNFEDKVVLKGSMAVKMASRVSYLVYYYCI